MTVRELKEQIQQALQRGDITEDSTVIVYNENFEVSCIALDTDDFELDENRRHCFSININERY